MAGTKSNPIVEQIRNRDTNSAAPTSVTLERSGGTYTLKWKRGATYSNKAYKKQEVRFRRKINGEWKDWSTVTVTATATSASKTYAISDYNPSTSTTLQAIQAEVRGLENDFTVKGAAHKSGSDWRCTQFNYNTKWSDYVKATFDVTDPAKPVVNAGTCARSSSTSTQFGYSVDVSDPRKIFSRIRYNKALVEDWGGKAPSSYTGSWGDATNNSSASGTLTASEPSYIHGLASGKSYTRLIRVKSQGPQGTTSYAYNSFIYAWPNKIAASNIKTTKTDISGGMRLSVSWTPNTSSTHPCSKYRVEYYIGEPANGSMSMPGGSISWTAGDSGTTKKSTSFNIAHVLQPDEALWVRVTQIHIEGWLETPSDPKYVAFGGVKAVGANDLSVSSYSSVTNSITLNCTNPSSISTSKIRVKAFYYANGGWNHKASLEIPHGSSSVTGTLDLNQYASWRFDTYVGIGGGYWSDPVGTAYYPRSQATDMEAFVPVNVNATLVKNMAGTAKVTWANVMGNVTGARITVADNADEWSKANPEFVVDVSPTGANLQSANIGNLEYGTAYWFRVQSTNGNDTTGYSAAASLTLDAASAPTPVLSATETADHKIRVQWNWDTWASATAVELVWSDNPQGGDTDYKQNETTVQRAGRSGPYAFTITEGLSRGKTWYIWASFISDKATSNPGTASCNLPVNPVPPTNITAVREAQTTDEAGKSSVRVTWKNNWADADSTEIAWAQTQSAWEATSGLNTYKLDGPQGRNTTVLIPNLQLGTTWYFKVNLIYDDDFETSYSSVPFTALDLRTDPIKPVVSASMPVVSEHGKTDISWTYGCEDGSEQAQVEVRITDEEGDEVTSFGFAGTETSMPLYPELNGLEGNNTYNISVRTTAGNNRVSEWSEPISINVIHKPIAAIASTSLVSGVLTELPLTVTVSGTNANSAVTVYIERAQDCFEQAPDESQRGGFAGELIAHVTSYEPAPVDITAGDLRGLLNDGGMFRLVAMVSDDLSTSDPVSEDFVVGWTHQAINPVVTREVDEEARIVTMTIEAPEGAEEGDVVDIYRLSSDKPELIVEGAAFGETYVDPYPAFGEAGGHRFVYRTANNDITTEDMSLAWIDINGSCPADDPNAETDAIIPADRTVINFDNYQIDLLYNLELSHSWEKDFTETKYLGGSVQGDWNPAVSRKSTIGSVSVTLTDDATIEKMRRLAVYPGICHVRTPDGSSFSADIQVSEERSHSTAGKIASFNLNITRVDAETLDGLTLAEWEDNSGLE